MVVDAAATLAVRFETLAKNVPKRMFKMASTLQLMREADSKNWKTLTRERVVAMFEG
mgnify:FL=1